MSYGMSTANSKRGSKDLDKELGISHAFNL